MNERCGCVVLGMADLRGVDRGQVTVAQSGDRVAGFVSLGDGAGALYGCPRCRGTGTAEAATFPASQTGGTALEMAAVYAHIAAKAGEKLSAMERGTKAGTLEMLAAEWCEHARKDPDVSLEPRVFVEWLQRAAIGGERAADWDRVQDYGRRMKAPASLIARTEAWVEREGKAAAGAGSAYAAAIHAADAAARRHPLSAQPAAESPDALLSRAVRERLGIAANEPVSHVIRAVDAIKIERDTARDRAERLANVRTKTVDGVARHAMNAARAHETVIPQAEQVRSLCGLLREAVTQLDAAVREALMREVMIDAMALDARDRDRERRATGLVCEEFGEP